MSERDEYPSGVPCWVDTMTPDVPGAIGFYEAVFGWEFDGPGPMPDPSGGYYVARLRGRDVAGVGSSSPGSELPPAWNTYVSVPSAEAAVRRSVSAGGTVLFPPFDALPAGRAAVIADPAGAVIGIWEPRDRQGARLLNEPSAWAMSLLRTSHTATAAGFYESVFGWRAETIDMGGAELTLFRLPGYVGGEPEQPVPRDMVAGMMGFGDEQIRAGVVPHWSVDFWIDDADAAAAKTPGLGGAVLTAPHELPPFRRAVLADPAGASFSVSQLVIGP
ncbi:MAG: VOC family protein [Actinomycetota bacterium]|nr:VOC family protein [Actinomycetota bacterium]